MFMCFLKRIKKKETNSGTHTKREKRNFFFAFKDRTNKEKGKTF